VRTARRDPGVYQQCPALPLLLQSRVHGHADRCSDRSPDAGPGCSSHGQSHRRANCDAVSCPEQITVGHPLDGTIHITDCRPQYGANRNPDCIAIHDTQRSADDAALRLANTGADCGAFGDTHDVPVRCADRLAHTFANRVPLICPKHGTIVYANGGAIYGAHSRAQHHSDRSSHGIANYTAQRSTYDAALRLAHKRPNRGTVPGTDTASNNGADRIAHSCTL
jgi:hypothetical protein